MSTHVLIPIHLDSLYLERDTPVAEARLNFDRLPYFDGETDQNPTVPYLGEEIQSIPFRNADRLLPKGLHLHWLLPQAFTKGLARPMLYYTELTKILGEDRADTLWNWLDQQYWIFPQIPGRLASLLISSEQFSGLLARDDFWRSSPDREDIHTSLRAVRALFLPRSTQFPAVPNRWVIRSTDTYDPSRNQQRILASDYVHSPEGMVMAWAGHGCLEIICTVILENRSSVALENVQIVDNLALSFPAPASDIRVIIAPRATGSLAVNDQFTGLGNETHLLAPAATLPAGAVEIITYTVSYKKNDLDGPVMDTATATVDGAAHNGLRVYKTAADSDNAVPFPMHFREPSNPPYRLLGNSFLPEEWEQFKYNDFDFLSEPLTALGSGDPTFSSFYPNCKGVFGWYDRTVTSTQSEITYEVFGYYGDPEWDYCNLFLCDYLIALTTSTDPKYGTLASKEDKYPYCQRLLDGYEKYLQLSLNLDESKRAAMNSWMENLRGTYLGNSSGSASLEPQYQIAQRIKEELRKADSIASFPKQSLLYAKMVYQPTVADDADTSPHQVAIGNTGTQALAAYLSNELAEDPGGKRVIEEFLESVQFSSRLQHLESDVGARFQELRHANGFTGSQGGTRWVVKPREHQPGPAQAPQDQTEVVLPDSLAHDLHTINATQRKIDRLTWQLESLKTQTYADWTKYMAAQYPPDVFEADYPDIDELRHLITTTGLKKIAAIEAALPELNSLRDNFQNLAKVIEQYSNTPYSLIDIPTQPEAFATFINEYVSQFKSELGLISINHNTNPSQLREEYIYLYRSTIERLLDILFSASDGKETLKPQPRYLYNDTHGLRKALYTHIPKIDEWIDNKKGNVLSELGHFFGKPWSDHIHNILSQLISDLNKTQITISEKLYLLERKGESLLKDFFNVNYGLDTIVEIDNLDLSSLEIALTDLMTNFLLRFQDSEMIGFRKDLGALFLEYHTQESRIWPDPINNILGELNSRVEKTEAGGAENLPTQRSVLAQQLTSLHVALFDLQRIEASEIAAARATISALAAADRTALETSITQLPAGLSRLGDLLLAKDDPLPDDIDAVVTALNAQLEAPALFDAQTPASPEAKALDKRKDHWIRDADGIIKEALRYNRLLLQQFVQALPQKPLYALQPQGNTRFWRPADPVVLLAGPAMNAHPRYGMQTSLRCPSVGGADFDPEELLKEVPADLAKATVIYFSQYDFIWQVHGKPGHPLFIDWLLDYHPTSSHIEKEVQVAGYPEDYVTSQFQLTENKPSLRFRRALNTTQAPLAEGGHAIWGSTVLSSQGGDQLKQDLINFLKRELEFRMRDTSQPQPDYYKMFGVPPEEADEVEDWGVEEWVEVLSSPLFESHSFAFLIGYLKGANDRLLNDYSEKNLFLPEEPNDISTFFQSFFEEYPGTFPAGTTTDRLRTWYFLMAMFAYGKLQESDSLAQALTGFNEALLMFKTGFQLDIADPLGFTDYQDFTREVAQQIGNFNRAAVLPANAFFPIRAGALKLSKLRIIDSFGMEVPIKLAQGELDNLHDVPVLVAEPLRTESAHDILLSPSFVQPARLNFRWLAAQDGAIESNDHPASSPICGWVLLNELDESLMIYSGSGAALGYIDLQGRWQVFPGHPGPVVPAGIENSYLRQLVLWIMDKATTAGTTFMDTLFANLNTAIDGIEPSQAEHFDGISLLMSQPLALVRASVQVELKGDAAIHQGWEALQKELKAVVADQPVQRETLGFEKITIPLRLGEQDQLNDGLVAFWVEDPTGEGYQGDTHFSPLDPTPLHIQAGSSSQIDDRSGLRVSMLIDPRGSVHATTGILPVKSLQLDAQWYRDTLKTLEVVFRAAPVLTRKDLINISLPQEAGYDWSWVARDKTGWSEITTAGHLSKKELEKAFPGQADVLWSELVTNKSLTPLAGEEALITLANSTKTLEDLAPDFSPKLGDYLRSRQIDHFLMNAQFTGRQVLKEGWLKLRQQPTKTP